MAAVGRLHPRHWDGHRLLQFLTGLALLALAFGTTAASAAPVSPPPAAVTTVDEAPAAAPAVDDDAAPVRISRDSDECQHDASRAARAVPPAAAVPAAAAAPLAAHALPRVAVTLAGIAQRAHGTRAPPR